MACWVAVWTCCNLVVYINVLKGGVFTYLKPTDLVGIGIVVPFYSHAIFLTPNRKIKVVITVVFIQCFLFTMSIALVVCLWQNILIEIYLQKHWYKYISCSITFFYKYILKLFYKYILKHFYKYIEQWHKAYITISISIYQLFYKYISSVSISIYFSFL